MWADIYLNHNYKHSLIKLSTQTVVLIMFLNILSDSQSWLEKSKQTSALMTSPKDDWSQAFHIANKKCFYCAS